MRLIYSLFIGFAFILAAPAHAQDGTVYEHIYQQELDKYQADVVDLAVQRFVTLARQENILAITEDDVDRSLQNLRNEVCRKDTNDGKEVPYEKCNSSVEYVQDIVKSANWLRNTVRDLQLSATSYEMGSLYTQMKFPSLAKIWQSDANSLESPDASILIRGGHYPAGMETGYNLLQAELEGLVEDVGGKKDYEKFTAAVWRYRNGLNSIIAEEGPCDSSNDGKGFGYDFQFLFARFCEVERILNTIHGLVPTDIQPALRPNERLLMPPVQLGDLHVQLWARDDDIGLQWSTQLEPVLPSMNCSGTHSYSSPTSTCKNGALLGGASFSTDPTLPVPITLRGYPPEIPDPDENEGLCSHPVAKRGYLCRKKYTPNCPKSNDETAIFLTDCSAPLFDSAPSRTTESGPNICGVAGWRKAPEELPVESGSVNDYLESQLCANCYVDFVCESNCAAEPNPKETNDRIEACVNESFGSLANYLVIREMARTRMQCNSPPGDNTIWRERYRTINGCCGVEYEASLAACNAMHEDGILQGVGISVPTCATVFANFQCEGALGLPPAPEGAGICGDIGIEMGNVDVLFAMRTYIDDNSGTLNVATSCSDAVQNMDPRALQIRHSFPQACTPDCQVQYQNTIGNAACHIGQCIEQSVEAHRVVPGRMTWTVGDAAYPWDADKEPPEYGTSNSFSIPKASLLPDYAPRQLAKKFDRAVCQLLGLPVLSPPTLCAFDARRRLYLPGGKEPVVTAVDIQKQKEEATLPKETLKRLATGIGARIGSDLYVQYFSSASRSLSEIIRNASALLTTLEEVPFPEDACPRINP